MAMLGASVPAEELSPADPNHLDRAFRLFYLQMRPKTDAAQATSRKLARMMAVESGALSWGREQLMRFYPLDRTLSDIAKMMEGSI
jgi:2-polyprenyl-6-methoxyphenol hydroxylase-like FAD-dependent oxidoreductase